MKMKRMEMRDVSIGEYQFKIRPFGAKDALYIFGDVASILLPILGSVAVASDDKDAVEMEMFDGVDLDTESLTKALGRINGKALSKLVSELILEHSNVSYRDPDRGSYQPVTEDEFDEIFCQYLAGVFSLCAEIIKLNFSGFFKDASTLFGGLIKVRRGDRSKNTENSTTNELQTSNTTEAQRQAKAELDAITRTSQSPQECLECPVSAGCGWCSGLNYELFGTADERSTAICWAHKARVLASCYYHNRRYLEIGDCLPIEVRLPAEDGLKILPAEKWAELMHIETAALMKFADEIGIS